MPKERLRLNELDQSKSLTQEEYKSQIKQYQLELLSMQLELHEKKIPVVFVLEGPDAAGKGGAIKRVVERLDPRLIRVYSGRSCLRAASSPSTIAHGMDVCW